MRSRAHCDLALEHLRYILLGCAEFLFRFATIVFDDTMAHCFFPCRSVRRKYEKGVNRISASRLQDIGAAIRK